MFKLSGAAQPLYKHVAAANSAHTNCSAYTNCSMCALHVQSSRPNDECLEEERKCTAMLHTAHGHAANTVEAVPMLVCKCTSRQSKESVRGQVPRLQRAVRDRRASWAQSLATLRGAKAAGARVTKTSLMLGCGESAGEVVDAMRDIRAAGARRAQGVQGLRIRMRDPYSLQARSWTPCATSALAVRPALGPARLHRVQTGLSGHLVRCGDARLWNGLSSRQLSRCSCVFGRHAKGLVLAPSAHC